MKVTHEFHNPVADASTGGITKPSHWNADHVIKDGTPGAIFIVDVTSSGNTILTRKVSPNCFQ